MELRHDTPLSDVGSKQETEIPTAATHSTPTAPKELLRLELLEACRSIFGKDPLSTAIKIVT